MLRSERVWPYRFEIDLGTYRAGGLLPRGTPDPYFDLWLFDDGLDYDFVRNHAGRHPEPHGRIVFAEGAPDDLLTWTTSQRSVLATLRGIVAELRRELDANAGASALGRSERRMAAIDAEHRPIWERIPLAYSSAAVPMAAPWTAEAQRRREIHRRNAQYGGGYSSG